MARGINEMVVEEKRLPTKEDLDEVISDRPVFVIRTCAHIGIANSKAIEISGVDERTEVPFGGEIRKNEDGSLQGIFAERALGLIMNNIPSFTISNSLCLPSILTSSLADLYCSIMSLSA